MPVFGTHVQSGEMERIENEAAKMGVTKSQYLRYLMKLEQNIDAKVREIISGFTQALEMSPSDFISTVIIDFGARNESYDLSSLTPDDSMIPFIVEEESGKQVKGKTLYDYLLRRYLVSMLKDDMEKLKDCLVTYEMRNTKPYDTIN